MPRYQLAKHIYISQLSKERMNSNFAPHPFMFKSSQRANSSSNSNNSENFSEHSRKNKDDSINPNPTTSGADLKENIGGVNVANIEDQLMIAMMN